MFLSLLSKILFVGHSLVGPTMPPMLEEALRHRGIGIDVAAEVVNGAPLRYNWDHTDAQAALQRGVDALILTEAIPLASQMQWNDSEGLVQRYAQAAWKARPDTQVYIYETWHSFAPPADDPGRDIPWRQRLDADLPQWQRLVEAANAVRPATAPPARLVPAGQAMARLAYEVAQGRVPGLRRIEDAFSDDIHLAPAGLYLVTMVHFAALTGQSPQGLPAHLHDVGIPSDQAAALQRIAWQVVAMRRAEVGVTNPDLALGLAGVHDWAVQQPFLDLMRTARPFVANADGQWGLWTNEALVAAGHLDKAGWPVSAPEGTQLVTTVLTDLPPATPAAGRYVLTWQGAPLTVGGRAEIVETTPHRVTFDFRPGPGGVTVATTGAVQRMSLIRQDRRTLQGEVFNPDWLARIRGVAAVRFMDWMAVNDSTLAHVADRPRPADFSWTEGVPPEIMVALANELQADPWFTIPHLADDALVRDYAEVVRDGLAADLVPHVEYSNEVWNWQFQQAHWAEAQGRALWGRENTWVQFYALRASEVMAIWRDVLGDDLVRIVTTQTGWIGLEEQVLTPPELGHSLADSFDAYAVTGYFSARLGEKADLVRRWLDHPDTAMEMAAKELRDGSVSGDPTDTLASLINEVLPHHARVARSHGLDLVMYEGGTHVVGPDDPQLTAFFTSLNYSPQMGALYDTLMQGWRRYSDRPFNAFVDVYAPGKWGSWGALRHLGDDNPRWRVLAQGCATC